MSRPPNPKDLKGSIEKEIRDMMKAEGEPSEGRMKLLKLGIGFLAVQAKLEESEYGGFFGDDPTASLSAKPKGAQPVARSDPGDDTQPGDGQFFSQEPTSQLPS